MERFWKLFSTQKKYEHISLVGAGSGDFFKVAFLFPAIRYLPTNSAVLHSTSDPLSFGLKEKLLK